MTLILSQKKYKNVCQIYLHLGFLIHNLITSSWDDLFLLYKVIFIQKNNEMKVNSKYLFEPLIGCLFVELSGCYQKVSKIHLFNHQQNFTFYVYTVHVQWAYSYRHFFCRRIIKITNGLKDCHYIFAGVNLSVYGT